MIRSLQYLFIAIIVTTVGFSLYQWNASRASTQKTAPNNGLVGYWSFDEGTGTKAGDGSVNKNTGTLTNGPTWVTGKLGQALNFDGVNDYVSVPNPVITAYPATITAWVKVPPAAPGGFPVSITNSNSYSAWAIQAYPTSIKGFTSDGNNPDLYQSISVDATQWTFVAFVLTNATSRTLYVNNNLSTTDTTNKTPTGLDNLNLGRIGGYWSPPNNSYENWFTGQVDELRIYNRALSGTEVTNLYNLGAEKLNVSPVSNLTSGLVGYWTFDGKDTPWTSSSAGTATDRSGNGNTGTLTNMSRSTSPAEGKIGQALNFNGTNQYVDAGSASSLDDLGPVTFSAWIFPKSLGGGNLGKIITKDTASTSGFIQFFIGGVGTSGTGCTTPTNVFYFQKSGATVLGKCSVDNMISFNAWQHVVLTWDGSTNAANVHIYKNGVELSYNGGASNGVSLNSDAALNLYVGNRGDGLRAFDGLIDDVRIYNRALSTAEVQSLYDLGASDKVNSSVSQGQGVGRLDSGLAGYWKLDDASGTTATDSSTNANNGTLTNGPTWGTGKIGGDVVFDGVDDYVNIPSISAINFDYNIDFSFSTWVKIPSTQNDVVSTDNSILEKWGNSGAYPYVLRLYNQSYGTVGDRGKVYFARYDATHFSSVKSLNLLNDNLWHLVNGTKSGATLSLYVDGVLQSTSTDTTTTTTTNAIPLYIGARGGTANRFQGSIDDVRIYNRALSADEVSQLYRLTTPTGVDTSLKGYWSFNGKDTNWTSSSAGTVADLSGSGNTGTMTNMSRSTSPAEGKLGQALNFDGVDDYVTTTNTTSFDNLFPSGVTLCAWAKFPNFSNYNRLITLENNGGTDYDAWIQAQQSSAVVQFGVGGSGRYKLGTTALLANTWYHLCGITDYTAGGTKIFINGVDDGGSLATTPTYTADKGTLDIGRLKFSSNSYYGTGQIDEVRIYNRALSATEITALYNSGR